MTYERTLRRLDKLQQHLAPDRSFKIGRCHIEGVDDPIEYVPGQRVVVIDISEGKRSGVYRIDDDGQRVKVRHG